MSRTKLSFPQLAARKAPLGLVLSLFAATPSLCAQGWSRTSTSPDPDFDFTGPTVLAEEDGHVLTFANRVGGLVVHRADVGGNTQFVHDLSIGGSALAPNGAVLGPDGDAFVCGVEIQGGRPFLMRYRPSVALVMWCKILDIDEAQLADLALGTDGHLLAVGAAPRAADIDVLAVRFDPEGELDWATRFGDLFGNEFGQAVVASEDGGFTVVARSDGFVPGENVVWAFDLDADGIPRWQRAYGGDDFIATDVVRSSGGETTMVGYALDPQLFVTPWILRVDAEGTPLWSRSLDVLLGFTIAAVGTPDGGVVTAGYASQQDLAHGIVLELDAAGQLRGQLRHDVDDFGTSGVLASVDAHPDGGHVLGGVAVDDRELSLWHLRVGPGGRIGDCCPRESVLSHSLFDRPLPSFPTQMARSDLTPDVVDQSVTQDPLELIERLSCSTSFGPWTDLGHGVAGARGVPCYAGVGSLRAGTPVSSILTRARPLSSAILVLGFSELNGSIFGGTLVPFPDLLLHGIPTGLAGEVQLPTVWPSGLPSGFELYLQYLIPDPSAPRGFAMSNGVRAITP